MKKILIGLGAVLIAAVVVAWFFGNVIFGGAAKRAIEAFGPKIAQVDVRVRGVNVSLLGGSGSVKGLLIGNPQGYKSPSAIKAESIRLVVAPASLFGKKVHVRSLVIESPEITFEGGLQGNNLTKILENVQNFTGDASKSETRLQVDEFIIRGGRINIAAMPLGGQAMSLPLSEVRLANLGAEGDGITVAELAKQAVGEVAKESLAAVTKSADQIFKGAGDSLKNLGEEGKAAADAVKGIGNFFK
ncbi:MAG: hypothetical protein IT578_05520 [Verrucomicrobiae bacterium]|nr:hypothetical protein [Verrucomicrobiae bacterium]